MVYVLRATSARRGRVSRSNVNQAHTVTQQEPVHAMFVLLVSLALLWPQFPPSLVEQESFAHQPRSGRNCAPLVHIAMQFKLQMCLTVSNVQLERPARALGFTGQMQTATPEFGALRVR